jgi:protein TonB
MEYRVWLIACSVTAVLHAAAWFFYTHAHAHAKPTYLHFSVVEASLMPAPSKTVAAPKVRKRKPHHQHAKAKPKLKPRPPRKPVAVAKPRPAPLPQPAKTIAATPHPINVPAPYTAPDYAAAYLHNPPPIYPLMARRRGISGRVLVRAEVTVDGHCRHVRVIQSSGYRILDETALAAVKKWRFVPASRGSRPVTATVDIPLNFKLQGES